MYIYFPSCNFQKQFPETAAKIRSYMDSQPDVTVISDAVHHAGPAGAVEGETP